MKAEYPACIDAMLYYIYNFKYDERVLANDTGLSPLCFHVQMCIIADKYDIPHLKSKAIHTFKESAEGKAMSEDFAHAAAHAYEASGATREICEAIVAFGIAERALANTAGTETALRKVMKATPELAVDYATVLESIAVPKRMVEKRFICPYCTTQTIVCNDGVCMRNMPRATWLQYAIEDE